MVKVKRKPVVLEAYQTTEDFIIETLEGPLHASAGDWIMTGVKGEHWAVKPDIFALTYEIIEDDNGLPSTGTDSK